MPDDNSIRQLEGLALTPVPLSANEPICNGAGAVRPRRAIKPYWEATVLIRGRILALLSTGHARQPFLSRH